MEAKAGAFAYIDLLQPASLTNLSGFVSDAG
jgi:hypothetical protein